MNSVLFALALSLAVSGRGVRQTFAATPSASFGVTATVQAACVVSATPIMRGIYAGTELRKTLTVSMNCTHPTPYIISIGVGPTNGGAKRKISNEGSAPLGYAFTSSSQGVVARASNASSRALVKEEVSAGQNVVASASTDTITVTLVY